MSTFGREQNDVQADIRDGFGEYLQEQNAGLDTERGLLREGLDIHFKPLDTALDTLNDPREAERQLLAKWTTLVDLAKSFGVEDYPAADALSALVIGKIVQKEGIPGISLQHETDESEDDYFDVIRLVTDASGAKRPSIHPSRRETTDVPDLNTPLPLLKPEAISALKEVIPGETVDRPTHNRKYYTEETKLLWRISARAEYLTALRKLKRAGVDITAIAEEVLEDTKGIEELDGFLTANDGLSARELAEKWGEEAYKKPEPSAMQQALRHQDKLQAEIRNTAPHTDTTSDSQSNSA